MFQERPQRIGSYEIIRELGRGGQGVVFLARDERLGRKVALKVLTGFGAADPGVLQRFAREAQVSARLDHPNVCTVYEVGEFEGAPFIAMQHIEGVPLTEQIRKASTSDDVTLASFFEFGDEEETVTVGGEPSSTGSSTATRVEMDAVYHLIEKVAMALEHAHSKGVVHRDIKPGNIMVDERGEPVVLDFGLAGDLESDHNLTMTGDIFGTPAYMAPEQVAGRTESIDQRTDVWALGVVLYECVTLKRPFEAPTRSRLMDDILKREPQDPRKLNKHVPGDLRVVIETALTKNRLQRYQTARDLAEDLRRVRMREPVLARKIGPLTRAGRWAARNAAIASLIAVAFVLLFTTVIITLLKNKDLEEANAQTREESRKAVEASENLVAETRRKKEAELRELRVKSERDRIEQEKAASDRLARSLELLGESLVQSDSDPALAILLALGAHDELPNNLSRQVIGSLVDKVKVDRILRVPGMEKQRISGIQLDVEDGLPRSLVANVRSHDPRKSKEHKISFDLSEEGPSYPVKVDLGRYRTYREIDRRLRWRHMTDIKLPSRKRPTPICEVFVESGKAGRTRLLVLPDVRVFPSNWQALLPEKPGAQNFVVVRGGQSVFYEGPDGKVKVKNSGTFEIRNPKEQEGVETRHGDATEFVQAALVKEVSFEGELAKSSIHPHGHFAAVSTQPVSDDGKLLDSVKVTWASADSDGEFTLGKEQARAMRYASSELHCCGTAAAPRFLLTTPREGQWLFDQNGKIISESNQLDVHGRLIDANHFCYLLPPGFGFSGIVPRRVELRHTSDGRIVKTMNVRLVEYDKLHQAGNRLILCGRNGEIEVIEPLLGESRGIVIQHEARVAAIDINENWVATSSSDGEIFLWNIASGKRRQVGRSLRPIIGPLIAFAGFGQAGPKLVATLNGAVGYSMKKGAYESWLRFDGNKRAPQYPFLAVNDDGDRFLATFSRLGSQEHGYVYDIKEGAAGPINRLIGSPNGRAMTSAFDRDRFLSLSGGPEKFCSLPFFAGSSRALFVNARDEIILYDLDRGTQEVVPRPGLHFTPVDGDDEMIILEDSLSGRIAAGSLPTALKLIGRDLDSEIRIRGGLSGDLNYFVRPEGSEIAWYATRTGSKEHTIQLGPKVQGAYDCVADRDGDTVMLKYEKMIRVFRKGIKNPLLESPVGVSVARLNRDGDRLAALSFDGKKIHMWNLVDGKEVVRTLDGDPNQKSAVFEWSSSGKYLLIKHPSEHCQVWDMRKMALVVTTTDQQTAPTCAAIDDKEENLVLGHVDGRITYRPIDRVSEARSSLPRDFTLRELVRFGFADEDAVKEYRTLMSKPDFIDPETGKLQSPPASWPVHLKHFFVRQRDEALSTTMLFRWKELYSTFEFANEDSESIPPHPLKLGRLLELYRRTDRDKAAFRKALDEITALNPGIRASFLAHKNAGVRL